MFNGKNQQGYYQGKTNDWKHDAVAKQLDRISQIVEGCQTAPHTLLLIFLPIPLITALRLQSLTNKNEAMKEFKGTVVWENWLVIVATISYGIDWNYLLPVLSPFWDFFHQNISLSELGENLWQFATIQAIVALVIHLVICELTCKSFRILGSFQERYDNLKNIRNAFEVNTLTEITLKAEFMKQLPGLLSQAISTQMNAVLSSLIVNGSLTSTQEEQLRQLLSRSVQLIANDVLGQINNPVLPPQEQQKIHPQNENEYDD